MDPLKNPFSPGAGSPPPELVGREPVIEEARILLQRILAKKAEKSILLTGLRGVGKTVLLGEIERLAKSLGYCTIFIEAHEDKELGPLLAPYLRSLFFDLNRKAGVGDKVKRGLAVLRSFIGAIQISLKDVTLGIDIEPERGSADSGDLEIDLPNLFIAVGEAAEEKKTAVAIFVDEIQYLSHKEFAALIMAMHKMQQKQLPIVLIGAGLPVLTGLAGESKSYAERLFNFIEIGALSRPQTFTALRDPVRTAQIDFEEPALEEVFRLTEGYPYFLQEWGYQAWNLAQVTPIGRQVIQKASTVVAARLDKNFFKVRFDRLTPSEKQFLKGMAELGPGPHKPGDIAKQMRVKPTSLSPIRAKLIKKGMIYSPSYGDLAFTVPLFHEFMMRAMS